MENEIMEAPLRRLIITTAVAGLIGGGLLAATIRLTTYGPAVYIPYTAMMLSLLVYFRLSQPLSFKQRFSVAFLAFMTATTIGFVYISAFVNPNDLIVNESRWHIAWTLAVFAAIDCVSSSIVAIGAALSPLSRR
jgi:hypothetical protein